MPNVRSQRVEDELLEIVASDGRSFTLTKADVQAIYQSQTGNAATRKQKTIGICKANMVAALGEEQVPAALIGLDLDGVNGRFIMLEILSALEGV